MSEKICRNQPTATQSAHESRSQKSRNNANQQGTSRGMSKTRHQQRDASNRSKVSNNNQNMSPPITPRQSPSWCPSQPIHPNYPPPTMSSSHESRRPEVSSRRQLSVSPNPPLSTRRVSRRGTSNLAVKKLRVKKTHASSNQPAIEKQREKKRQCLLAKMYNYSE